MRLNELLEEQSIKAISHKTMISEDNIQRVVSEDYEGLTKAKALGFLSILEREYGLDLKDVRNNAVSYFEMNTKEEDSINIALPRVEERKGRSKWLILVMLGLLGYASWYFFTQFDQKTFKKLLPSSDTPSIEKEVEKNDSLWSINQNAVSSSESAKESADKNEQVATDTKQEIVATPGKKDFNSSVVFAEQDDTVEILSKKEEHATDTTTMAIPSYVQSSVVKASSIPPQSVSVEELNETDATVKEIVTTVEQNNTSAIENNVSAEIPTVRNAVIKPVKRLWFGLVNMRTGKRDHFSVRKAFTVDMKQANWLVATSPAPFTLVINGKTHRYNNGKAHYFKITKAGLTPLSKKAYVRQGGYRKW